MGIFVTVRKCPKMAEHVTSIRTMQAVRRDSLSDLMYPFKSMSLLAIVNRSTAKVPTLPASVGVKNPFIRPPITTRKMITTDNTSGRDANLALHVDLSPFGPMAGLILHHP
jgi:hypothetical protein